jgi:hypothetical protein
MEYGIEPFMGDMVDREYAQNNASHKFRNKYFKSS